MWKKNNRIRLYMHAENIIEFWSIAINVLCLWHIRDIENLTNRRDETPRYGASFSSNEVYSPSFLLKFKAGPLRLKQLTNTLKLRIFSQTSILICYPSVMLSVGHHM